MPKRDENKVCRKVRVKCGRAECNKRGRHRCSRCMSVSYCCQECLTDSWTQHQPVCDEMALEIEKNKLPEDAEVSQGGTADNTNEAADSTLGNEVD